MSDVMTAGPIRNRLRERLKARVVKAAQEQGADPAKAGEAFEEAMAESDRPFLDWLLNGGFEKLLEIVLNLLKFL